MSVLFFENKYYPSAKTGPRFDEDIGFHHEHGVAFQNEDAFFARSLNHGGDPHYLQIPAGTSITLRNWVEKSFGDSNPVESDYVPGTFYKRMWRPMGLGYNTTASPEKLTQSFVSLRILLNKLEDLFETLEPTESNLLAYGHKVRELILLACMEVESGWCAVLKENGYRSGIWTTKDYIKLRKPMCLDAYELSLQQYPKFPSFSPFKDWEEQKPTKSLVWYDAYNEIKHDREENLKLATLQNAVLAVGAAVVIFYSQYGSNLGPFTHDQKIPLIRSVFKTSVGFERYEREFYIPKLVLPLNSAFPVWTAINYPFQY